MSREDPQLKLRLPATLKQLIEAASINAGRSMNAEIVSRLQDSFENNSPSGNLITLSMDDLDTLIESAIDRTMKRSK